MVRTLESERRKKSPSRNVSSASGRKPRTTFSDTTKTVVSTCCKSFIDALESKKNDSKSVERKKKAWVQITANVNNNRPVDTPKYTTAELQGLYTRMMSSVRAKLRLEASSKRHTGGGPARDVRFSNAEDVFAAVLRRKSPTALSGLKGLFVTFCFHLFEYDLFFMFFLGVKDSDKPGSSSRTMTYEDDADCADDEDFEDDEDLDDGNETSETDVLMVSDEEEAEGEEADHAVADHVVAKTVAEKRKYVQDMAVEEARLKVDVLKAKLAKLNASAAPAPAPVVNGQQPLGNFLDLPELEWLLSIADLKLTKNMTNFSFFPP